MMVFQNIERRGKSLLVTCFDKCRPTLWLASVAKSVENLPSVTAQVSVCGMLLLLLKVTDLRIQNNSAETGDMVYIDDVSSRETRDILNVYVGKRQYTNFSECPILLPVESDAPDGAVVSSMHLYLISSRKTASCERTLKQLKQKEMNVDTLTQIMCNTRKYSTIVETKQWRYRMFFGGLLMTCQVSSNNVWSSDSYKYTATQSF